MKPSLSLAYAIKRRSKTSSAPNPPANTDAPVDETDLLDETLEAAEPEEDLVDDEPLDEPASPIAQIMAKIRRAKMSTPNED